MLNQICFYPAMHCNFVSESAGSLLITEYVCQFIESSNTNSQHSKDKYSNQILTIAKRKTTKKPQKR